MRPDLRRTAEEIQKIVDARIKGFSYTEIANKFGISRAAVAGVIYRVNGRKS